MHETKIKHNIILPQIREMRTIAVERVAINGLFVPKKENKQYSQHANIVCVFKCMI